MDVTIMNLPKEKVTSAIIIIKSIAGKKYTLILDLKKDKIGLSRFDKESNHKFISFVKISTMIGTIEKGIEECIR